MLSRERPHTQIQEALEEDALIGGKARDHSSLYGRAYDLVGNSHSIQDYYFISLTNCEDID